MDNDINKVVKNAAPPNAGKGRVKGVPNKTTRIAKDAIAYAAEQLGGADRLVSWAKEDPKNEQVFWGTIYPKLLPLQVANAEGEAFRTITKIELVALTADDSSQD